MSPLLLTLAFFLNTLSILFSLSSNSFILIWFMMEISMLSFMVILMLSQHNLSNTYVVKYFMFQTFSSVALVVSFSNGSTYHDTLIFISMMKLGTAPFHMWFMSVVEKLSFMHMFWLAVPQKIIPLRMMQLMTLPSSNFNKVILVSVALASLHMITQLKLLKMLAASSVYITPWIVFSFLHSDLVSWVFFLLYSLTQGLVISLLFKMKMKADPVSLKSSSLAYYNLVFLMLTMAGFPPSPLFFMKLYVVFYLFTVSMGITALGLMLIASVSMFNYLNMVSVSAVTSVSYSSTMF